MDKRKAGFLKKRAEEFFSGAQYHLSKKNWELSAFNLEQACQLYLKYYLFSKLGNFPPTHSLKKLLKVISEAAKQTKKVQTFTEENIDVIVNLENAYLTSRYLPVEFEEREVKNMEKFAKKLLSFLKKL